MKYIIDLLEKETGLLRDYLEYEQEHKADKTTKPDCKHFSHWSFTRAYSLCEHYKNYFINMDKECCKDCKFYESRLK